MQVFGYSAWSLLDGFEWNYGYSVRRGLFYVDFNQPNGTRVPKTTAQYFKQIVNDNGFPADENSSTDVKGHFPCKFHWGIADSTLQVKCIVLRVTIKESKTNSGRSFIYFFFLIFCCFAGPVPPFLPAVF